HGDSEPIIVLCGIADCSRTSGARDGMNPWIPESAFIMVDDHNPEHTESKPLTTELETLAPEATADHADLSSESTPTQQHETAHEAPNGSVDHAAQASHTAAERESGHVATVTAGEEPAEDDLNYDAADFAAALANFDREQAADAAAAQNLTAEEVIVPGTVLKITDKHVVVDIGL